MIANWVGSESGRLPGMGQRFPPARRDAEARSEIDCETRPHRSFVRRHRLQSSTRTYRGVGLNWPKLPPFPPPGSHHEDKLPPVADRSPHALRAGRALCPATLLRYAHCTDSGPFAAGGRLAGWRGPNRDGICREKGLLKEWPHDGPKLLWKTTGLGIGYGGPALVGNVLYIMGANDGKEWVLALDVRRGGKQIWASAIDRSALTAAVIPARGRRLRSTAIDFTPWASPAIWCA